MKTETPKPLIPFFMFIEERIREKRSKPKEIKKKSESSEEEPKIKGIKKATIDKTRKSSEIKPRALFAMQSITKILL